MVIAIATKLLSSSAPHGFLILGGYLFGQAIVHRTIRLEDVSKSLGLLFDILLLSYLIYIFAGVLSGWVSLLLIPALIGALSLPIFAAVAISASSALSYFVLLKLYLIAVDEHAHHMHTSMSEHLFGMLATFIVSVCLLTIFISRQVSVIREQQGRLSELKDRQWRQQQIMNMATYSANTAHKLATPLATSKMLLEEALEEIELPPHSLTLLTTAQSQLAICESTLEQMRQRANFSAQQQRVETNASIWLEQLLNEWWNGHNEIQLQMALAASLKTRSLAVSDSLVLAIYNLLDNSANAATKTADTRLIVEATDTANMLEVTIKDFGGGISPEAIAVLGKRAQESESGMGIGLLLTSETIEAFGGQLDIINLDAGAQVTITLPLT